RQAYPGIDIVFHGNEGRLEYDFVVSPGASISNIGLIVEGSGKPTLDREGALVIKSGDDEARMQPPKVWQADGSNRKEVKARYELREDGSVAINVDPYDRTARLVVDPVLVYSTYFGGSGTDAAYGISVDAEGSVYIAGRTSSIGRLPS